MAKPRYRQVNMDTFVIGLGDHKILIYTLPKGPKHKEMEITRDQKALKAHGIATKM